ncbi:MAG TPA: cation:proton antiporter [Phycisphaerae bacterium]|nr:cation:proton antiporter [Phycisphaerae bacterium]
MPGYALHHVCPLLSDSSSGAAPTSHGDLAIAIGLAIVAATMLAYLARVARQPLLLAYIAAGVAIGPKLGLGWVSDTAPIETLARLGLAFLLFIVGLEIDLRQLLATGRKAAAITAVQVVGSYVLVFTVCRLMGVGSMQSAYLGIAGAFSSTMITVKLLSDRSELGTLPGRVTLGVLLLQDVLAIVVLAIQPSLGKAGSLPIAVMGLAMLKGLMLLVGAIAISRFVLPLLFKWVAKTPEVLLLSAISWCFMVCYAAILLGFSEAMGALIAGVSIAQYPYTIDVVAKVRSLRDFFVTLFFVSLGMLLEIPAGGQAALAAAIVLVVIASRVLTVWPAVRVVGYDDRVGILSAIHLSQTGEFGLVVVLLGATQYRHVASDSVSLVIILLLVTSTLSTYLLQFSHPIALHTMRWMSKRGWARRRPSDSVAASPEGDKAVMLVGCFRTGAFLVHKLRNRDLPVAVIDFNPRLRDQLNALGVPFTYGDISHLDTLEHGGVENAKALVVPISDDFLRGIDNPHLLKMLRRVNPQAKIIVTATSIEQATRLYELGADYVVLPELLSAEAIIAAIDAAFEGHTESPLHSTPVELAKCASLNL